MYQFSKMLYRLIDFSCGWFVKRRMRCGKQKKNATINDLWLNANGFSVSKHIIETTKWANKKSAASNKNRTNQSMRFTEQDFNRLIEKDFAPNEIRLPFFFITKSVSEKVCVLQVLLFHGLQTCECTFLLGDWCVCFFYIFMCSIAL